MRTRAAAALHKVLTFQDVRGRVADATPSVVASLVGLLRQEGSFRSRDGDYSRQRQEKATSAREGGLHPQLSPPAQNEIARLCDEERPPKLAKTGQDARAESCQLSVKVFSSNETKRQLDIDICALNLSHRGLSPMPSTPCSAYPACLI